LAINPTGAVPVPLTVYGSWVTEVSPDAVPENISPDCQDVAFAPGSVGSRPALQRVYSPCPAGGPDDLVPTVTYSKSFKTPTGDIKNLTLDSNGILWVEDLSNPGVLTQLFTTIPGSYARSITTFGREYIAISDGLHGADIPLQYDGTNLDRFTQGGPGTPPAVQSLALSPSQMASSGNTLTRNNNTVTGVTATPNGLQVGYQVQISNVPDSNASDVVQTGAASVINNNTSFWGLDAGLYRSVFGPGTSPLSAFTLTNFGFTIPGAATILGVVINFDAFLQGAASPATIAQVALEFEGAVEGTPKSPATSLTTTPTAYPFGSAADLWGASLTPTIVNDPSFGFAISITLGTERVFLDLPFTVQVFYTLSGSGTVAEIASIVINNESFPGLALVTTENPHGLAPDEYVSIVGVEPGTVANVADAQWVAGITTLTTSDIHNLNPGAVIQVEGVATSTGDTTFSFNGTFTVETVPGPNQLTYVQVPITATDPDVVNATASTGSITVAWPIPSDTPTPTYFEVVSAPTPTTFYIQVNYSDATWTTGTVGFIWEGTFYVTAILSPTEFQYQQYGPNGATTAIGTVTPFGQAAPGLHLCQVLFLRRQGGITAPSPPVTFIANGGQYISVSNIPTGPPDCIGRILAFTGAQPEVPGELPPFFYIPSTPQTEGQIVGTATQINDNTTTSIVLDFADNTLFAAIGISVTGNTLANQIVLDGALGFGAFESRLTTWGQRNDVQNFLNLSFAGGVQASGTPTGWQTTSLTAGGALTTVTRGIHTSAAWSIAVGTGGTVFGQLTQGAFEDAYGDPIIIGNQTYSARLFVQSSGAARVEVVLSSASSGFFSNAFLNVVAGFAFYSAAFTVALPESIPTDLMLSVQAVNTGGSVVNLTLSDLEIQFAQTPFTDTLAYGSYVDNPEGIDGTSGQYGADDPSKLMDQAVLRDTLYLLTQAPSGRLHETNGSATSEPSGWQINEVASNCGTLSAFGLTHSQADDTAASGGDDWMAWPSEGGGYIFGGGMPEKITQEIQPNWFDPTKSNTAIQINMQAALTAWGVNDPVQRLMMFGLPIGTATAPNKIYVLNYRNLNSAQAIAGNPPFHPSFAGKLIATDNSRKWAPWNIQANGAARVYRQDGTLTLVLFGGNGQTPGAAAGFGNIYTLSPGLFTDQDYGQIFPYYTTYFFVDPEKAAALQLPVGRLMLSYMTMFISGLGTVTPTPLCDALTNPWTVNATRTLGAAPMFDLEVGGGYAQAQRMAFKIASVPVTGTDNSFQLSRFVAWFKAAKMPIRGAAQ
jgi:hypothetical protein